jgi:hypothetical protein
MNKEQEARELAFDYPKQSYPQSDDMLFESEYLKKIFTDFWSGKLQQIGLVRMLIWRICEQISLADSILPYCWSAKPGFTTRPHDMALEFNAWM